MGAHLFHPKSHFKIGPMLRPAIIERLWGKRKAAGHVDIIDRRTISGWASPPQALMISVNKTKVGEAQITEAREDVRAAGLRDAKGFF